MVWFHDGTLKSKISAWLILRTVVYPGSMLPTIGVGTYLWLDLYKKLQDPDHSDLPMIENFLAAGSCFMAMWVLTYL
jgi:hypothetical protein